MKYQLILVTGAPGSGKTYRIMNDPKLKGLPRVDIRYIYESGQVPDNVIEGWKIAQEIMIQRALGLMEQKYSDVVCEAILMPGTPSRERIIDLLGQMKVKYRFVNIKATYATCITRVHADYLAQINAAMTKAETYYRKRMDILESYHSKGLL